MEIKPSQLAFDALVDAIVERALLPSLELRRESEIDDYAQEKVDEHGRREGEPNDFYIDFLKYARPQAASRFLADPDGLTTCGSVEWEKVAACVVAGEVIETLRERGVEIEEA